MQSWSLAAPFYRNNSEEHQGEEQVAVEKHLLQNWVKWVLLLQLPVGLGWLPFLLGCLGEVQQVGTFLGWVGLGLVGVFPAQLSTSVCKKHVLAEGGWWAATITDPAWGTGCPQDTHPCSSQPAVNCTKLLEVIGCFTFLEASENLI